MTNLTQLQHIATLVKFWAEAIRDSNAPNGEAWEQNALKVAEDMLAFSKGLAGTVNTFAPIMRAMEQAVAESKGVVAYDKEIPIEPCPSKGVHPSHNWRQLATYACPGNTVPPMVPEEV